MLSIVLIVTFVSMPCYIVFVLFPDAFAIFKSFLKLAIILTAITPSVDSLAMRFALLIKPIIVIPVTKEISTLAMLQVT